MADEERRNVDRVEDDVISDVNSPEENGGHVNKCDNVSLTTSSASFLMRNLSSIAETLEKLESKLNSVNPLQNGNVPTKHKYSSTQNTGNVPEYHEEAKLPKSYPNINSLKRKHEGLEQTSMKREKVEKRHSHTINSADDTGFTDSDSQEENKEDSSGESDIQELLNIDKVSVKSKSQVSEFLDNIDNEFEANEELGEKINEKLASIIDKRFKQKLLESKLKEKGELYLRPENCPALVVPSTNIEIWSQLNNFQRKQDIRMGNIQRTLLKASYAVTQCANLMIENADNDKNILLKKLMDALALLGNCTYDISLKRRELLKVVVNQEFKSICSSKIPVTDLLFGPDLSKTLKDIKEGNALSKSLNSVNVNRSRLGKSSESTSFGRSGQYSSNNNWSEKKNFLDRRRWHQRPPAKKGKYPMKLKGKGPSTQTYSA